MRANELKHKIERGEIVLGPFMNCCDPSFIEIVGLSGFDFAIVDMEHGPLSVETAADLCRAGQRAGLDPIVRVRKNDAPQIQRALDIGSAGVQVPQIETREQAEAVVRAAKYAPLGMRGISLYTRAGDYTVNGLAGITNSTRNNSSSSISRASEDSRTSMISSPCHTSTSFSSALTISPSRSAFPAR